MIIRGRERVGTYVVDWLPRLRAGVWTPAKLTTALWLDASDSDTITLDGSRNVELWDDLSGNDCHATQTTEGSRPSVSSAAINGLDALSFSSDFLTVGTALGKPTNYTIFVIVKPTAVNASCWVVGSIDSAGGAPRTWGSIGIHTSIGGASDATWWYGDGTNYRWGGAVEDAFADNTVSMNCVKHTDGTQDEACYRDGATLTIDAQAGTATAVAGTAYDWSIGRCGAFNGQYWPGLIGEVIVFTSALSDIDRRKVEGYLAWKWGLEANLPANHPYKSAPP